MAQVKDGRAAPAAGGPDAAGAMDKTTRQLRIGVGGAAVTALCCVTPILSVLLGAAGVAAWIAYADFVLFPTLAAFAGLAVVAWRKRRHAQACCAAAAQNAGQP